MQSKIIWSFLFVLAGSFLMAAAMEQLNHQLFLKEMKNSSDKVYYECLSQYDQYLISNPNDVDVLIERCKFIQLAQYDDYEEYNPNQEAFDSSALYLEQQFPEDPRVLLFQTSYKWGDDLDQVLQIAEKSIKETRKNWSSKQLAAIYQAMADDCYWKDEYSDAYAYSLKAINFEPDLKYSLNHARILIETGRNQEALSVLRSIQDTTTRVWQLNQVAYLLIILEAYPEALAAYNTISELDSSYNNNQELASTLEGIGKYNSARTYLLKDTATYWNKETAKKNLFIHDFQFQESSMLLASYNAYRDLGYAMDPLGIYRLKIFFKYPTVGWRWKDMLGLFTMFFTVIGLILLPSVWVLPVYFVGKHWNLTDRFRNIQANWGLKGFWLVSSGYLIATLIALSFGDTEFLYSILSSEDAVSELKMPQEARMILMFFISFGLFAVVAMIGRNPRILLSTNWTWKKTMLTAIGWLLLFRFCVGIYVRIGGFAGELTVVNLSLDTDLLLATQEQLKAILGTYGNLIGFILIAVLVPIYEEIIFRGVILDSISKYLGFNSANGIQAILFGLIHESLFLFPAYVVFALLAGYLRKRSGGLVAGMIIHMGNNALVLLALILRS